MKPRPQGGQKGFTLIELLIVVAIIGILASMLIPNLLDAMQKAKQKRTMADMRITGGAMFSWLTDQVGAAAAGQTATQIDLSKFGGTKSVAVLESELVPTYIQDVADKDGWKNSYLYFLNITTPSSANLMAIASGGRGGAPVVGPYTSTGFEPTDYDQDIVWANGFFVRWPQNQRPGT
jgi:prepilin-type N-terminal cleavage/methylation domain-containing protein